MLRYQEQYSELTLHEGIEEFYSVNKEFAELLETEGKNGLFFQHDITHVIFGLDSSIEQEHLLDTWALWGTRFKWKIIRGYFKHPAIKQIYKDIKKDLGAWGITKKVILMIPLKILIIFRALRMKKKWDYHNITNEQLNTKLSDIRKEYNINVFIPS